MKELDCRGLACPQPVLKTKEALEGLATSASSGTTPSLPTSRAT
ncbi:MAG: sulfurtransferase TusA family protein [Thermodesulfobacteriota bacterium]|nr:sulfurtransferase TusA family protein [Thermodesulfobacteriota bacterium]